MLSSNSSSIEEEIQTDNWCQEISYGQGPNDNMRIVQCFKP